MDGMLHRTARWLAATVLVAGLAMRQPCRRTGPSAARLERRRRRRRIRDEAPYAILIDARTGNVFYENHADELMAPASMSKLMTMIMVFEAPEGRQAHPRSEVHDQRGCLAKRGGASSGGSTMYAELNSRVGPRRPDPGRHRSVGQ